MLEKIQCTLPNQRRSGVCIRLTCFVCICLIGVAASFSTSAKALDSKTRADFEWFSTLGFPDVSNCPCVQLENGGSWDLNGKPERIEYIDAFVLTTNAGNLKLFATDLSTRAMTNADLPKGRMGGGHFEWVNLSDEAHAEIAALQNRPAKVDPFQHFNKTSEELAEVFVLAWGCSRHGLLEEAQQLYNQAEKLPARLQCGRRL